MKKPHEYLEPLTFNPNTLGEEVIEIIKQVQLDTIETTCKRCAEEARGNIYNIPGPGTLQRVSIDKGSILKVADKMKEKLE